MISSLLILNCFRILTDLFHTLWTLILSIDDCGMEGVLPPEIAELDELLEINLSDNEIDGGVPSSWSRLEQLG